MHRPHLLAIAFAFAVLAASCGDSDTTTTDPTGTGDGVAADVLDGREFWSVSVVEGGAERLLVEGTRIALRFDGDQLGASAGCNSMGASYEIGADGELVVGPMAMTEMGCDLERHAQDDFVAAFLSESPSVSLDGDSLGLATDEVLIELLDREVADPDRRIVGTKWTVTGFIQGDAAMSMAVDEDGWIEFPDSATMRGYDGCVGFTAPVEVSDGSTGGPVEGDGEVQFGPIETDAGRSDSCKNEYADAVTELFATGDASFTISGPNMTMLNRDGTGVTFRAAGE